MRASAIRNLCTAFILIGILSGCVPSAEKVPDKQAEYHNKMGMAYLNEGKIQLAFLEFQKAEQIEPNNKDIVYNLGIVYLKLEDYENAKQHFLRAIKLDPNFSDAYNNLGYTYMQLGQWPDAVVAFKKALSNVLYRTPEKAFYSIGMSYYRLGEYEKAVDAFKDSIRRDNTFVFPYYSMALAYNKLERFGEAADMMDRAIMIDPGYRGNRDKKLADLKERFYTAKGEEEQDLRDFLDIMQY
ncbi:MAG: tetratricopeptide repeat protein [Dissulfurispiraceae bacterium]